MLEILWYRFLLSDQTKQMVQLLKRAFAAILWDIFAAILWKDTFLPWGFTS